MPLSRCDVMMSARNLFPFQKIIGKFLLCQRIKQPRISFSPSHHHVQVCTICYSCAMCTSEVRVKPSAEECLLHFSNSLCIYPSSVHGSAVLYVVCIMEYLEFIRVYTFVPTSHSSLSAADRLIW